MEAVLYFRLSDSSMQFPKRRQLLGESIQQELFTRPSPRNTYVELLLNRMNHSHATQILGETDLADIRALVDPSMVPQQDEMIERL